MPHKLRKFLALPLSEKGLFIKAWCLLGWMRAAILTTSFKRLSQGLDHHRAQPAQHPLKPAQLHSAHRIGYLVAAAASVTPWQSLCLVQVLVAQRLLASKHIAGQFYLGVEKSSENTPDSTLNELSAHAWLECGGEIVNGGTGCDRFTVVSVFSWSGG
jgi:hypothetical protein